MKSIIIISLLFAVATVFGDFINGGFEQDCTSFPFCLSDGGLPGWTFSAGSVDVVNQAYWDAHSGSWSIDTDGSNGDSAVTMSQDICTTVGNTYVVTFWMSPNHDVNTPGSTFSLQVSATGAASQINTVTRLGNGDPYVHYYEQTYTFVATAHQTTFTIQSLNPGVYGAILDDVSISGDGLSNTLPCTPPAPTTAAGVCLAANPSDWTYGQGYYCFNHGYVLCWGYGHQYFACPQGTSCICADSATECSSHGTASPCE